VHDRLDVGLRLERGGQGFTDDVLIIDEQDLHGCVPPLEAPAIVSRSPAEVAPVFG
jgi:hypothetical protein